MNTKKLYDKYLDYCHLRDIEPISKKQFTAVAWVLKDITKTKEDE